MQKFDEVDARLMSNNTTNYEVTENENILRPLFLDEFIGQDCIKENLKVYLAAAKKRGESLDHVLLYGPPGLGKTTLSRIIANEMVVDFKVASGPSLTNSGELAALLTSLQPNSVLFIDEIHRLNHVVEESLYPVMEDFKFDMFIGKGPSARPLRLDINKFTLVGATTKAGNISSPLRDRFGVFCRLEIYSPEQLVLIVKRTSKILNIEISEEAAYEIASRSRGTPRIANRLLKRVRDYASCDDMDYIDISIAKKGLKKMEIDELGLDRVDRNILKTIIEKFNGGPVGLDTIAASSGEESVTIEDVYEPYLLQLGFIARTPRGRICTKNAYEHLKISFPKFNTTNLLNWSNDE